MSAMQSKMNIEDLTIWYGMVLCFAMIFEQSHLRMQNLKHFGVKHQLNQTFINNLQFKFLFVEEKKITNVKVIVKININNVRQML